MRPTFIFTLLAGLVAAWPGSAEVQKAEEWISLFNGKDLTGWTPKITGHASGENFGNTFRVEDGLLKVNYDKYGEFGGQFGHLFYKEKFSHYVLRVEYRFVGDQCKGGPGWAIRNSGIMFHAQAPQEMRKEQEFPVSVEFQFLGGVTEAQRPTGSVCTPGTNIVMVKELITRHCTTSKSKTFPGDQWVVAELHVNGSGTVKHVINGDTVMEYERPQLDPKDEDAAKIIKSRDGMLLLEDGYIALQAESHPVEFRKVEVKVLKK